MSFNGDDIPLVYVYKQERDKLQSRLKMLVPYTKRLEQRCKDQENLIKQLRDRITLLREVQKEMLRGITASPPYKELLKKYQRVKQDNRALWSKLSIYLGDETRTF